MKNIPNKKVIIASIVAVIIIGIAILFTTLSNDTNNVNSNEELHNSSTTESTTVSKNEETPTKEVETETTTKKSESTTKKEQEKETATRKETTTKSAGSSIYLEATANELNNLQQFLNSTAYTKGSLCTKYSSGDMSYKEFINNYLLFTSGDSFIYGKYFNAPVYYYDDMPDPLNKFTAVDYEWKAGQYFKYSKANIDWIMKNIYNIPSSVISNFSASVIEDEDTYYHDGYIYQERHMGFGGGGCYIEVNSYNRLEDGKYSVSFCEVDEFSGSTIGSATAIVSMKKIGGTRYWTLHSIY